MTAQHEVCPECLPPLMAAIDAMLAIASEAPGQVMSYGVRLAHHECEVAALDFVTMHPNIVGASMVDPSAQILALGMRQQCQLAGCDVTATATTSPDGRRFECDHAGTRATFRTIDDGLDDAGIRREIAAVSSWLDRLHGIAS